MKIQKKLSMLIAASLLATLSWAAPKKVVASTSWSAAFADIAGADEVESIAPVNLRHPPEYEITVSDVQKISDSEVFIFAGFERMMKTLGTKVANKGVSVQVTLDNSLATVKESTLKIAQALGTEDIQKVRFAEYEKLVKDGQKKALKKKNDDLTAALEKSQQQSTLKKLQEAKLQQDYADACAILDRIPPEIIREYTNRSTKKQEVRHYR